MRRPFRHGFRTRSGVTDTRGRLIPRLVVLACLPLTALWAVLQVLRIVDPAVHDATALMGFAVVIAYLFAFRPALYVCEPFAVIATLWLTRRWYDTYGAPFAPVVACWAAVLLHSAALVSFLALGR